jgi:DNA-binding NarL/FixJ family response regulator
VLARLVEGKSTKAIAAELCVSHNTARTHIQNVLTKLGVHSRLEAAARAVKEQLI